VYSDSFAVGSGKSVFNGYYFSEDSSWRDKDPNLTDADLRAGTAPVFLLSRNWLPGSKITQRDTNNFFQVLESKVVKNKGSTALSESYSSAFYEGLRSDPIATVANAKLSNCAILTAENGNAGLASGVLDYPGKWSSPGVAFSSNRAHTGRYSFKVTDNFGPTINLYLKDVRSLGFGFKVSAWVYADTGTPVLTVERHHANGSSAIPALYSGSPVSGSAGTKKAWQRWELTLTNSQLSSDNLFIDGVNDYLRIWVGTGSVSGSPNKNIYVDDIVCVPTNAGFSLYTYSKQCALTSSTDAAFNTVFTNIGFRGQVSGAKDGHYRSFGQTAFHQMGEN
jgi:hypothetical protein